MFTNDDLTKIDRALASGNLIVRIGDREIRKYTAEELMKIRGLIISELGVGSPQSVIGVQYVNTSKGLP